jgi:hypothetical protein
MDQHSKPEHIDEQLISYLDGELPLEQEDAMFQSLAANADESRSTMRDLITMRNVIPHDIEAFTPPPTAKDAVFSQLGMSSNPAVKEQSTWKKALLPLAFLAAGLAGGYGIGDSFSTNERNEIAELMRRNSGKETLSPLTSIGISPQVPSIILQQKGPVKIVYKDRTLNTASVTPMITLPPISVNQESGLNTNSGSSESANRPFVETQQQEKLPAISEVQPGTSQNKVIAGENEATQKTEAPLSNVTATTYPQFWMQMRGLTGLQSPEFSGIREQLGILDNSRITFAWSFGEHIAIGLEAGREPFVLQYHGLKEDRSYTFNQYSPMLTGGLFLQGRTSPLQSFGNSRIYAQAVAGGTEIGLLGRLGIGISYPITQSIGLQFGVEQSYMRFQFQGNWFDSQKLDLLYGISITL